MHTETRIMKLDSDERILELAKMLSANKITDAAVAQAKELLNSWLLSNNFADPFFGNSTIFLVGFESYIISFQFFTSHRCASRAHVACLLTTARILALLSDKFEGTVLLVFQPGEEKAPGGARLMIEDGVFDDMKPELMLAQHISVDYPTGTLAFGDGKIMASADEIHVDKLFIAKRFIGKRDR